MVIKNTNSKKLCQGKNFGFKDTSYSSFWLFNKERDLNSLHLKDSFVNFYDEKELLSEFNPTIAKNIISFWSEPTDLILDPFAGRTRAIVSYAMNRRYVGYEVSKDVIDHMKERFEELKIKTDNIKLIHDDCINLDVEMVDLIFTCPPYYDLERYQSTKGQLSDVKGYSNFLDELVTRLNKASSKLKTGKYMCVVIGDFRRKGKYTTLHSDLMTRMNELKQLKLHDVIIIQNIPFNTAVFYFGARKKHKYTAKVHEYLLVWKKREEQTNKNFMNCEVCGNEIERVSGVQKYCSVCKKIVDHQQRLKAKRRYDAKKKL